MRYAYRFETGELVKTNLLAKEMLKRMNRLDTLRVLTEQHECKEAKSICKKALKAYNKLDGFTRIIRLTFLEKDWLAYMLEDKFIDDEDRECIEFYVR